jgi:hypothetical protein
MNEGIGVKLNLAVAGAAITSPSWLSTVDDVSAAAAPWLPILGFILLLLQIAKLIWDWSRKPKA